MLPVCDPPPPILEEAIASVERQSYPHWQLCIADDASRDPAVREVLAEAEARDPRIGVVWRPQRGHISAATNSALAGATGEWVTFLDHDDRLHEHALHHMAAAIVADPSLDLIYSDEDKIDEAGSHFEPHFKPDWDPDRLLAQNYVCHLAVYRRTLVDAVGGCGKGWRAARTMTLFSASPSGPRRRGSGTCRACCIIGGRSPARPRAALRPSPTPPPRPVARWPSIWRGPSRTPGWSMSISAIAFNGRCRTRRRWPA